MATNTDEMVRQLVDALERMRTSSLVYAQETERGAASTRRNTAQAVNISASLQQIRDRFQPLQTTSESLVQQFNELRSAAIASGNRAQISERLREIADTQSRVAKFRAIEELGTFSNALKVTAGSIVSTVGNFTRGLQQGASGVSLSSGVLSGGLGLVGRAAGAGADALFTLSESLKGSGRAAGIARATAFAGGLFLKAGEKTVQATQFVMDILNAEIEKTNAAFSNMVTAGALFSNGLTGMREAAGKSGLTLAQFSAVVKSSAQELADLGLGVAPAAKKIGAVLTATGDSLKTKLQNLGFSFEEQGVLIAETMRALRQSGGPLRATDTQIAQATEKYAENLRIIAGYTGEDARQRMNQARQAASTLAFQQKLAGMEETQRLETELAMANMTELQRKNFMDMVVFGTVINREGAIAQSMSRGLASSVQDYYQLFNTNNLTAQGVRDSNKRYGEQVKSDILSQKEIGMAAYANVSGLVTALGAALRDELLARNKATPQAIEEAEKSAQAQKVTTDAFTKNLNSANLTAQKFAIEFENLATNLLPTYATILSKTINFIYENIAEGAAGDPQARARIDENRLRLQRSIMIEQRESMVRTLESLTLTNQADLADRQTFIRELKNDRTTVDRVNEIREQMQELIRKSTSPPVSAVSTPTSLAYTQTNPLPVTVVSATQSAALGGVLSGPKSGYIAMLHGTEAVIPLPDGQNVPVKMDSPSTMVGASDSTTNFDKIAEILSTQTRRYEQIIDLTQSMLSSINDHRNISKEMLNNAYS